MTIPVFLRTFCKYTQKPRAMQMRKHLTGPFRDRQKTSVLWMLRNGSVIQAVRLALPRREQYMWTRSGQISQKPNALPVHSAADRRLHVSWMLRNGPGTQAVRLALPRREPYMWPSGQIYAEAESNANLFAIAEAQQYKWPSGQITQKPRAMQIYLLCRGATVKMSRTKSACPDRPSFSCILQETGRCIS